MLVWVGRYYSDIIFSEYLFSAAITLTKYEGVKKLKNYVYLESDEGGSPPILDRGYREFVVKSMKELLTESDDYRFMYYTDAIAASIINDYPELEKYIIATNFAQHSWLQSKTFSRLWVNDVVDLPGLKIVSKSECTIEHLSRLFEGYSEFVVQEDTSSGGQGTFLLNERTLVSVHNKLRDNMGYVVSPYIDNSESINVHLVISNDDVLVYPYTFQDIVYMNDKLEYWGTICKPEKLLKDKVNDVSYKIGKKLQSIGYRGVCGIDYMIKEENLYFVEFNCRFQGSTMIADYFTNKKYGISFFDLCVKSFTDEKLPLTQDDVSKLDGKLNYTLRNDVDCNYPILYKESGDYRFFQIE